MRRRDFVVSMAELRLRVEARNYVEADEACDRSGNTKGRARAIKDLRNAALAYAAAVRGAP